MRDVKLSNYCYLFLDGSEQTSPGTSQEHTSPASAAASPQQRPIPASAAASPTSRDPRWADHFEINWGRMPASMASAVKNDKRPSPADRREFIRRVVDDMRVHHENPNKAQVTCIAKAIVRKYPASFEDRADEGESLGSGYHSLVLQMKTRVEHLNRNNTMARLRKPRRNSDATAATPAGNPADAYGCASWQPEDLPEGETSASLEARRVALKERFHQDGVRGITLAELDNNKRLTYIIQREDINSKIALAELKEKWPFMFMQRWMCAHFLQLTGIPIHSRMLDALEKKGNRIRRYSSALGSSAKKTVSGVLSKICTAQDMNTPEEILHAPATLLLIMAQFEEKVDSLIQMAEVSLNTSLQTIASYNWYVDAFNNIGH